MTALALRPFSAEWADAFRAAVDASDAYKAIAGGWRWPIAFVLEATPELGYTDAVAVELTFDGGRCSAAALRHPEAVTAPFVLRAGYATWKEVVTGALDPMAGVSRGRIGVTGPLMTLLLHSRVAGALCACARTLPTAFPDEA